MYTRRYHDIKLLYIKMFDVLYMCAVYLYIFPSYKIEIHIHIHTVHESHVCSMYVLSVWDEQKLFKSINTKYQVLRKIGKISELEKFSSL